MISVAGIAIPLDYEVECRGGAPIGQGILLDAAAQRLGLDPQAIRSVSVVRRSVDARKKSQVHFVVNAAVELAQPALEQNLLSKGFASYAPYQALEIPSGWRGQAAPVVVGTGPAGLFAALYLAWAGCCPVVVERGQAVEQRAQSVQQFNQTGQLDLHSNIQFGEGGAGTFSDGKLATNTNNAFTKHVLHWFAQAGAPESILWQAQPHIGSDKLPAVVAAMRNEIIALGGQVLFDTQLTGVQLSEGRLASIELTQVRTGVVQTRACSHLVLACGHSARNTFVLLHQAGVHLEQKPFAIGLRIEHPQQIINQAQWGAFATHPALDAAAYKLVAHGCSGRSVFSFCMCPGGEVVCAASEEGGIATNGMSPYARNGAFANAGLLVGVVPGDFSGSSDVLAGMRFQREIEQRAYEASMAAGGAPYQVPAQTLGAFLANTTNKSLPATSCARGVVPCNLRTILPSFVCDALVQALPIFEKKIAGFAADSAVLLGPETRSSSPVRIARNEHLQAWLDEDNPSGGCGIYPAGEGAGYAGGITSAACDGLRVATQLLKDGQ